MASKKAKLVSLSLAVTLLLTFLAGCSTSKDTTAATSQSASATTASSTTLTYWCELNPNVSATAANLGDTEFAKALEAQTGIKVKFIHPSANQAKEALNTMLASGDLPDIIEYDWYNFPGGPEKAIQDGYILKLNDTMAKSAPNLTKYLAANPEVDKMVKTDSGSYYVFPFMRGDDKLMVFNGPIIRKDWLDELGLQVPTTIDEWTTVLKAFKEKKGATSPLVITSQPNSELKTGNAFVGAYNVGFVGNFYVDNGKVQYGPANAGFKDFLVQMNQWYKDGLLDKNFATVDGKTQDALFLGGKSGATIGYNGGTLGRYQTALKETDPKAVLVAAPYPTLKKGDMPEFGQRDLPYTTTYCAAITGSSKNVELATRLLDYGYSEKGQLLYNFGVEGASYTMKDGKPTYTDLIVNNPDKLPLAQAMAKYIRANSGGPFIQNKGYIEQYLQLPAQQEALNTWMNTNAAKHVMPRISATPEESAELSKLNNEITTYSNEMFYKFVIGVESLDNFDKFQDQLKKMQIDRVLEIYQAALDRYNKR